MNDEYPELFPFDNQGARFLITEVREKTSLEAGSLSRLCSRGSSFGW